ncbi:MAG: hypothetical protein KC713_08550, partial [Candidatus Omnitrophica bacterium]|nr:hypothetical protein [Candidatus Omnitrophota bacterium]
KIAQESISNLDVSLKSDGSVITNADKKVSEFFRSEIQHLLEDPEHILIDEEDPDHGAYFDPQIIDRAKYIWAIDPIDGTRIYANQMPYYGVSIGLLKDKKPWMGVVYFPGLQELYYADGNEAFFLDRVFTSKVKKTAIQPIDQDIDSTRVFYCSDSFFQKFEWDNSDCHVNIPACAVLDLCWPAIGRGCGAFMRTSLWDMAGSWPIVKAAGLDLRNHSTGAVLDRIALDDYQPQQAWKLKDYYILSSERNFPVLQKKLRRK